jgi:hypothetical protein
VSGPVRPEAREDGRGVPSQERDPYQDEGRGRLRLTGFRPARLSGDADWRKRAYESARPPVLASEMVRIPEKSGHVAHGEDGILIRPARTRVLGGPRKW